MKKYYGEYIVGRQSDWVTFANEFNLVVNDLVDVGRKSITQVGGEWLWLVELWNTDFHMLIRAWKLGLIPLKQWQAAQLGGDISGIKGKDGLPILNGGNIIAGREKALLQWVYTLEPTMPDDLTTQEILSFVSNNNTKQKLTALFDAYESEEIMP